MEPMLMVNPRSDEDFAGLVRTLASGAAGTPEALQRQLRERYPRAVVRERALSDERPGTWYVYREGSWTRTA